MKDTPKSPDSIWSMIEAIRTAMLVTHTEDDLDARPLQAYTEPQSNRIFFMTDSQGLLSQLQENGRVLLSFAGKAGNDYVTVTGLATVENNRAKIRELWTVWAQAFWDGPEDPSIRVISVTPEHARYWDGKNPVATAFSMLKSVVTGKQPELGTSGKTVL